MTVSLTNKAWFYESAPELRLRHFACVYHSIEASLSYDETAMHNEFTAMIETALEGGYFAYCPEIAGANGQGETVEECRQNLAEAIALILDDRREDALRGVPEDVICQIVSVG